MTVTALQQIWNELDFPENLRFSRPGESAKRESVHCLLLNMPYSSWSRQNRENSNFHLPSFYEQMAYSSIFRLCLDYHEHAVALFEIGVESSDLDGVECEPWQKHSAIAGRCRVCQRLCHRNHCSFLKQYHQLHSFIGKQFKMRRIVITIICKSTSYSSRFMQMEENYSTLIF